MRLPTNAEERKAVPICTGALDYFPDALVDVARCSLAGNKQHNLGPLHWDKSKSTDEADALVRHLLQRGTYDTDGVRHTTKVAWRALALLQRELDGAEFSEPQPKMGILLEQLRTYDETKTLPPIPLPPTNEKETFPPKECPF